jgi:hypothetical protein
MGLSISHETWQGPYSAFHRWRKEIAKLEDIPLELMEGFYPGYPSYHEIIKITLERSDFNSYLADTFQTMYLNHLPLKWDNLKRNPLHKLLYHSDCEGTLNWRGLKGIYERLEYLMEHKQKEMTMECVGKTNQFIIGCKAAYEAKESLRFS